jgi:dienelactone hydrolase
MRPAALVPLMIVTLTSGCVAQPGPPQLAPGRWFTVAFPEMPPTLFALWNKRPDPAQMTVFLPRNYDPQRKHPLLIFLNGWDGGNAGNPTIARALSEEQDFVCVALPLFKERLDLSVTPETRRILVQETDGRYAWPYYRAMLQKLDELVPNLDPAHQVLGGFSNGAHMVAGLVNESDGEAARRFSAFLLGDGGGGLRRFDLLKDKPLLMVCGVWRPKTEAALAAGVSLTVYRMKEAKHAFPASEYPAVREWLFRPALGGAPPAANGGVE